MTFGYDAAIFDMDGTLLDSMRYWRYTSLEYLLKHHLPIQPDILTRMIDTSSRKLLGEVMSGLGLPYHLEEAVAELEGYMDRHYQADIQMKPCVPEFLHFLQTQGVKMCVATAVTREIAVRALEKQGIAHLFEFITDIHEFGLDKTQPEYFHVVARRLNCPINAAWYSKTPCIPSKPQKLPAVRFAPSMMIPPTCNRQKSLPWRMCMSVTIANCSRMNEWPFLLPPKMFHFSPAADSHANNAYAIIALRKGGIAL